MVKLSNVFCALALATTAHAGCLDEYLVCGRNYMNATGAAGTDFDQICSTYDDFSKCYKAVDVDASACDTEEEKANFERFKKEMDEATKQADIMCGGRTLGCSMEKLTEVCHDPVAKVNALFGSMNSFYGSASFEGFNDFCANGLTYVGAYSKCAIGNGCSRNVTEWMDQFEVVISTACEAGPWPQRWLQAAMADDAFVKCVGDLKPKPEEKPTCEQTKKYAECGKAFPVGTTMVKNCEAFKKENECADLTCPTATTKAAADSSPAYNPDTGAASTAQISASVVIAAFAFAGMAN